MAMHSKWVNGALVFYDGQRWYDAIGPSVTKVLEDFAYPCLSHAASGGTSAISGAWTVTAVEGGGGDSTVAAIADGLGGILSVTSDAADGDGINAQVTGESFTFTAGYPTYFGARFKLIGEVTDNGLLIGLCETDTTLLGGMNEGVYFRKPDTSTTLSFVLEEGASETVTAYGVLTADTWYTVEFVYTGSAMNWYVNGVQQTSPALTNLTNAAGSFLTPSFHFLTGEANANELQIDWIKAIQIQTA